MLWFYAGLGAVSWKPLIHYTLAHWQELALHQGVLCLSFPTLPLLLFSKSVWLAMDSCAKKWLNWRASPVWTKFRCQVQECLQCFTKSSSEMMLVKKATGRQGSTSRSFISGFCSRPGDLWESFLCLMPPTGSMVALIGLAFIRTLTRALFWQDALQEFGCAVIFLLRGRLCYFLLFKLMRLVLDIGPPL